MLELGVPMVLERNGPSSSQYAKALFYRGWLSFLEGRFEHALPPMRQALAIHENRVDGKDRGMLQVLRTTLAQVLIESGQATVEARTLLESVIAERSQGDALATNLAYARLPLAQWYAAHGDGARAQVLLEQVSAVGAGVEQELHARVAATQSALRASQGDLSGAAQQAKAAYEIMLADRGNGNPRTIRYALAYARASRAAGAPEATRTIESEYRTRLLHMYPRDSAFHSLVAASP
jgi:serine/threonine-protein kinase